MDTVLAIPHSNAADPVASVKKAFQMVRDLGGGLLFFKSSDDALSLADGIAAQPQHMVNVRLGKRKSRGCFHILCFIYFLNLFRFREEQV